MESQRWDDKFLGKNAASINIKKARLFYIKNFFTAFYGLDKEPEPEPEPLTEPKLIKSGNRNGNLNRQLRFRNTVSDKTATFQAFRKTSAKQQSAPGTENCRRDGFKTFFCHWTLWFKNCHNGRTQLQKLFTLPLNVVWKFWNQRSLKSSDFKT